MSGFSCCFKLEHRKIHANVLQVYTLKLLTHVTYKNYIVYYTYSTVQKYSTYSTVQTFQAGVKNAVNLECF